MEASLTCAVCLSVFENPTTLPVCSHNFCKKCILECVTKSFSSGGFGLGISSSISSISSSNNIWRNSQLECPLCRKSNLISEGAVNLPGNTTLAEVVRLFRCQQQQAAGGVGCELEELGENASPGAWSPGDGRSLCERHPPRCLQLFCKVCKQAACGQCVSEHHRGVFHSVNLVDMIYQEEKLDYFNNMRELRQLNERLKVEVADVPSDRELMLEYEKEVIASKFDEISENLVLKKKQLLDKIEKEIECKKTERKACLARKQAQKDTIEKYLKDCEILVNECNPVNFLKVACDLNERVRSNLAIVLPTMKKHNESACLQPSQFHIQPILDSISALQFAEDTTEPSCALDADEATNKKVKEGYRFKTPLTMWKQPKDCVAAEFSEVRFKYYQSYRKDWNCFMSEDCSGNVNSSASAGALEKCDGVEQRPVKLFSFGHSSKKVKKKIRVHGSGNLELQLPLGDATITSTTPIPSPDLSPSSNFAKLPNVTGEPLACDSAAAFTESSVPNFERLLTNLPNCGTEQKKQEDKPVPSPSSESETISSTPSVVKTRPTGATAFSPATSTSCTAVPAFAKTDEHQLFRNLGFGFAGSAVTKSSELPHPQNHSSTSVFGLGPVQPTATFCASHSPTLSNNSAVGNTANNNLATKTGNEQALLASSFRSDKASEYFSPSSTLTSLTSVFHNKIASDSPGENVPRDIGQSITPAADSGKGHSVGTACALSLAKTTEECSQKNSPKSPFSLKTLGPLGDQSMTMPMSSIFSSEIQKSKSLFTSLANKLFTEKSTKPSRNWISSSAIDSAVASGDASTFFTQVQAKSDVPNVKVLSLDRSSVFKFKEPSTVTAASTLFSSSPSSLFSGSFKPAQRNKASNYSSRSLEMFSGCSTKHSTGSIPVEPMTCLSQQLLATSQHQNIVKPFNLFEVKKEIEIPIVAEPSRHNNSPGIKNEDLPPALSEQSIDETSTNDSFEKCKPKKALQIENGINCKPVVVNKKKAARSRRVHFMKEHSSAIHQLEIGIAHLNFGIGTSKAKETATSEAPRSTQQSRKDEESDPGLQLSNMTPSLEASSEKFSNNVEERGKESPVLCDQIEDAQGLHFSKNLGRTGVHHSSATCSDISPAEHENELIDKAGSSFSPAGRIVLELPNLSHSNDFTLVPPKSSSFGFIDNVNTKAEAIQKAATDSPLATAAPVFSFGAGLSFQFKLGESDQTGERGNSEGDCKTGPKPMFPFPPPVDHRPRAITTEDILFSNRGRLYYLEKSSLQWMERGFGEIRILRCKTRVLPRLVMWNSANQCCANHWITGDLELKESQNCDHNWTWSALDYSERKATYLDYAVHFKLKEAAQMFRVVFETVQSATEMPEPTENNASCSAEDTSKCDRSGSVSSAAAPDLKEEEKLLHEDEDVVMLSEVTATPEQRALALKLLLPPTFFCYKNKPGYHSSSDDEDENFETALGMLGGKLYRNKI
ncbi:uncharacterized protein LOC144597529 isoform X2 [Rhinoraja longicauda]